MTPQDQHSRLPFAHIEIDPSQPAPLDAARQIVAMMFDLDAPSPEVADHFHMNVTVYDLGQLQISTCLSSASILQRSQALIALTRVNHFLVQFYRNGSFSVTIEGEKVAVPSRALAFFDLTRPCTIEAERVDNLALAVSPDLLLPLVANPDSIHGLVLAADNEANVALTMHLDDLWHRLPEMSQQQAQEEAQAVAAMLAAAIGAQANTRSMARAYLRKSQFGAICRWIDENLGDPSLAPADITRKFYITRPTLYRMFEQRGGIMKYILERRLEKVFHDLVDRSRPAEKIGTVMRRWGLRDHTSAGRAFRSYFGVMPKQVRSPQSSQMRWFPLSSTEAFRVRNIEQLGPLLRKHKVRFRQEDGTDVEVQAETDEAAEELSTV